MKWSPWSKLCIEQILNPLVNLDWKIAYWWMKITGKGRRSYFIIVGLIPKLLLTIPISNAVSDSAGEFIVIYGFLSIFAFLAVPQYFRWLRQPSIFLSTINLGHNVYIYTRAIKSFGILFAVDVGYFVIMSLFGIWHCIAALLYIIGENWFYALRVTSGPPKPKGDTVWQSLKKKAKNLLPKPQFTPVPVGV